MISEMMIKTVRLYQKYFDIGKKLSCCKYTPTCSEYAIEAIEKYGAFKGFCLAAGRILRCNPFARGGYDPVP